MLETDIGKDNIRGATHKKNPVRLKSYMFSIRTPLIEKLLTRTKMFWI